MLKYIANLMMFESTDFFFLFLLCRKNNWPRATKYEGKKKGLTRLPVLLKVMDKCLETSLLKEVKL
ncbi:hypothetical protein E2C01_014605 [Portunus trituberculatus]|uniref:Uncharacterized protein n=1 Tax=Portunus trituberculatus TaxID=210409 RepID=A0A5B7DKJ7_PORTR|nr:hypothetical protein [Portunus trituberculatus]